jgi:hypothetical protein
MYKSKNTNSLGTILYNNNAFDGHFVVNKYDD